MKLVFLGLSLSSAWGNGHAVTYRALLKALARRGHRILFLERDVPWYAAHRDLPAPEYCELLFYKDQKDLQRFAPRLQAADAVIVGSYVPDGIRVGRWAMAHARGPISFYDIDTPVTLATLVSGACDYLSVDQVSDYDIYFSFTGGPTLRCLTKRFGSPAPCALFCSADTELYHPVEGPRRWDLSYLGTFSEDRQPSLERLLIDVARQLPDRRFVVAGPQYPDTIKWPDNVERIEHLPPTEHPAFYCGSRFTLNLTRADMIVAGHSPSVRLFEAAACAAPVISDSWPGIETLFAPGKEIILAENTQDVVAALEMIDSKSNAMGEAARGQFLQSHTPEHRAGVFEREILSAIDRRGQTNKRMA